VNRTCIDIVSNDISLLDFTRLEYRTRTLLTDQRSIANDTHPLALVLSIAGAQRSLHISSVNPIQRGKSHRLLTIRQLVGFVFTFVLDRQPRPFSKRTHHLDIILDTSILARETRGAGSRDWNMS
jgi:hypothetical protein